MELPKDWSGSHRELADAIAEAVSAKVTEALALRWQRDFELLSQDIQAALAAGSWPVGRREPWDSAAHDGSSATGSHSIGEFRVLNDMLAKRLKPWNDDCAHSLVGGAGTSTNSDVLSDRVAGVVSPQRSGAPHASCFQEVLPGIGTEEAWGCAAERSGEELPGTATDPQDPGEILAKSSTRRSPMCTSMRSLRRVNNSYWISSSQDTMDAFDSLDASQGESTATESSNGDRVCALREGPRKWLVFAVPRLCGLLPWSRERKRLALAYQASLVLLSLCLTVAALGQQETGSSAAFTDALLGFGSLLSLTAGLWTRQELVDSDVALADNLDRTRLLASATHATNLAEMVGIWLVAVGLRLHAVLADEAASLPGALQFALSSFILLSMTAYFRSIAKTLQSIIENYCCHTFIHLNLERAEVVWNVTQAMIRNSCHGIEHCFVLTQVTGIVALLAFASDMKEMASTDSILDLLPWVPGALVGLGISKTLLHVASLTDMCERVPSLLSCLPTEKQLDVNRMHLVQHIAHSQTGFYTFNVCLSSAVVLKLLYLTCVLAVAIGTRI